MKINQKPWQERVQQQKTSNKECVELLNEKISGYLSGLAVMTQSMYPKWLMGRLQRYYGVTPEIDMEFSIGHIRKLIDTDHFEEYDYETLCQVMIEPFYLIDQKEKENSQNGI